MDSTVAISIKITTEEYLSSELFMEYMETVIVNIVSITEDTIQRKSFSRVFQIVFHLFSRHGLL